MRVTVEYAEASDPVRRAKLVAYLHELIQIHCKR